jgi:hypothetical protein
VAEVNFRTQYRWLSNVPYLGDTFEGSARLEGWTFHMGFSLPGDLLLFPWDGMENFAAFN